MCYYLPVSPRQVPVKPSTPTMRLARGSGSGRARDCFLDPKLFTTHSMRVFTSSATSPEGASTSTVSTYPPAGEPFNSSSNLPSWGNYWQASCWVPTVLTSSPTRVTATAPLSLSAAGSKTATRAVPRRMQLARMALHLPARASWFSTGSTSATSGAVVVVVSELVVSK